MTSLQELLNGAIGDARNGWSIGTMGAIGEFMWDRGELLTRSVGEQGESIVTSRGGMAVTFREDAKPVAYDTLSGDGETWGGAVAFCMPLPTQEPQGVVRNLGPDTAALRAEDRGASLFDLGVGLGHVRLCVRTREEALTEALAALEGRPVMSPEGAAAMGLIVKVSPHRVALSPLGRIEVYAPIPGPGSRSPIGPHTHVLPKLLAARRTHAANVPIPQGLQAVLMLHPRSPWRDAAGERTPFDSGLNEAFEQLLDKYGLPEDRSVRRATEAAVSGHEDPAAYAWPDTRRGRTQGRITLRRLAQRLGPESVARWRQLYDRTPAEEEAS